MSGCSDILIEVLPDFLTLANLFNIVSLCKQIGLYSSSMMIVHDFVCVPSTSSGRVCVIYPHNTGILGF